MEKSEKLYTLKFLLNGLYKSEGEIKEFLSNYKFSLNFIHNFSTKRILFNLSKYKNLQIFYHLKSLYEIRENFCKFMGIKEIEDSPIFLIRVDDFPHWKRTNEEFKKFNAIMEKFEIPYLLGVIPKLSLNIQNPYNKNFKTLEEKDVEIIKNSLIEIAMHGFSHQTNNFKKNREFSGIKEYQAIEKLEKGFEIFKKFNISPIAFIPPFDEIDFISFKIISNYFKP